MAKKRKKHSRRASVARKGRPKARPKKKRAAAKQRKGAARKSSARKAAKRVAKKGKARKAAPKKPAAPKPMGQQPARSFQEGQSKLGKVPGAKGLHDEVGEDVSMEDEEEIDTDYLEKPDDVSGDNDEYPRP